MKSNYLIFISALWLGQATAMALPNHPLRSYDCENCDSLSHLALDTHWALKNKSLGHVTKHKQESLKYRLQVNGLQLQQGVTIHTLAPGAIIRIVPVGKSHPDASKLRLRIQKDDVQLPLKEASTLFAQNEALQDSAFTEEAQTVLQLKPELGSGKFTLNSDSIGNKLSDQFIIHVFDQASTTYLSVETDKAAYQYGDELLTTIRLSDDAIGYPIDIIKAYLYSTDGDVIPLALEKGQGNVYQARQLLDSEKNPLGRHWYVEAEVSTSIGNQIVNRYAHSAFSYAIPSAEITELRSLTSENFSFSAAINVATGSRYALQAVLFATNKNGKKQAIQNVQSATWLAPGQSMMYFSFPLEVAKRYRAPYYLGSIQLIDYGQLKSVYEYRKPIEITKLR